MTTLDTLHGWGGDQDAFRVARAEPGGGSAWSATLATTGLTGNPGLEIGARRAASDERIWLQAERAVPAEAANDPAALRRLADELSLARHGATTCALLEGGGPARVEIRTVLHADGFTRDALNQRVCEVAKAARMLDERLRALAEAARLLVETERLLQDETARVAQYESEMAQKGGAARSIAAVVREAETQAPAAPAAPGTCGACGATNPPASRFCGRCGAELGCPSCGAANPPEMRFCVRCGKALAKPAR